MQNVAEPPRFLTASAPDSTTDYSGLKQLLKQRGLFKRQPRFYLLQGLMIAAMFGAGIFILFLPIPFAVKLLDTFVLAMAYTQVGYILHDAGHRQIFARPRDNDTVILLAGFLLGMSRSWWVDNHNMHHSFPNDLEYDPHTALPVLAFSEEQARSKQGFLRSLTRYQAYYFYPMLFLEGFGVRLASAQFMLKGRARYPVAEATGFVMHFAVYGALLLSTMTAPQALLFFVIHQAIAGFYMGSVFAPNHKGMPVIGRDEEVDFLHRQVLTTRNVAPHPVTDFWCGGLNYQIEHHLFPTIPRNKLKETRLIVRAFCERNAISYQETGFFESYRDISHYLNDVVQPLRASTPA